MKRSSSLEMGYRASFALLLIATLWLAAVLPPHAFALPGWGLRSGVITLLALSLTTLILLWRRHPAAPWLSIIASCGVLTAALYGWATALDPIWPPATAGLAIAVVVVAFVIGEADADALGSRERIFYATIFGFPAWVAIGGLFMPAQIDQFLPFKVPPLHARFIGAVYAAGAVMMALSALSTTWRAVRVATVILGIWTGLLGLVSLIHLDAFDWSWRPTWFWWFAYLWFPVGAAFIVWTRRRQPVPSNGPALSGAHRSALATQGAAATVVALALLLFPNRMAALWPWAITPLLAQIYSAPFLAYGLGSLYAARQHGWTEIRIPVLAILVLTTSGAVVSLLHSGLFAVANPSTWVWFGGLSLAALAMAALTAGMLWRNAPQ